MNHLLFAARGFRTQGEEMNGNTQLEEKVPKVTVVIETSKHI